MIAQVCLNNIKKNQADDPDVWVLSLKSGMLFKIEFVKSGCKENHDEDFQAAEHPG